MSTKIALGLAALGRPDYINIRDNKTLNKSIHGFKKNTFRVLDEAYKKGIRHFDVAASYGYGEQFLLDWIAERKHQDLDISTKWGYTYVANWEIGYSGKHEIKEHSLTKLNEQWSFSKQFLPLLNLYQIHSATLESGVLTNQDVLNRLYELKQKHKINIGLSTSGANQESIIKTATAVKINGENLFDTYQVTYNILEQSAFNCLKQLLQNGKKVIIKEALANGRMFPNYQSENYIAERVLLTQLATEYNVGIDAIALRFIIDNLGPDLVLSGVSSVMQLNSNMDCLKIELPLNAIDKLKELATNPEDYWTERSNLPWQ